MYGDGSQQSVLTTAGIDSPKAFVVTYDDAETSTKAVERLHQAFPDVPIYARALDVSHFFEVLLSWSSPPPTTTTTTTSTNISTVVYVI